MNSHASIHPIPTSSRWNADQLASVSDEISTRVGALTDPSAFLVHPERTALSAAQRGLVSGTMSNRTVKGPHCVFEDMEVLHPQSD